MGGLEEAMEKKISLHIKAELAQRGLNIPKLTELFLAKGYRVTQNSIRGKVDRGKFTFAFYLQFMDVIGVNVMSIDGVSALSEKNINIQLNKN